MTITEIIEKLEKADRPEAMDMVMVPVGVLLIAQGALKYADIIMGDGGASDRQKSIEAIDEIMMARALQPKEGE